MDTCLAYLTFLFVLTFPVYVVPVCIDREFSGGWRMRLALAKALFAKYVFLLARGNDLAEMFLYECSTCLCNLISTIVIAKLSLTTC